MKHTITLLIAWLIAMPHAAGADDVVVQLQGRVEQIDIVAQGVHHVWLRPAGSGPIRVTVSPPLVAPPVGAEVVFDAIPLEPIADRARDGAVHTWATANATAWRRVVRPQEGAGRVLIVLVAILAVVFVAVLLAGRMWMRPVRPPRRAAMAPGWEMESTDLPEDPADALAELARRADEVDT